MLWWYSCLDLKIMNEYEKDDEYDNTRGRRGPAATRTAEEGSCSFRKAAWVEANHYDCLMI